MKERNVIEDLGRLTVADFCEAFEMDTEDLLTMTISQCLRRIRCGASEQESEKGPSKQEMTPRALAEQVWLDSQTYGVLLRDVDPVPAEVVSEATRESVERIERSLMRLTMQGVAGVKVRRRDLYIVCRDRGWNGRSALAI